MAASLLIGVAWWFQNTGQVGHPICMNVELVETNEGAVACGYQDLDDLRESLDPPLFVNLWLLAGAVAFAVTAGLISRLPRRRLRRAGPPTSEPIRLG